MDGKVYDKNMKKYLYQKRFGVLKIAETESKCDVVKKGSTHLVSQNILFMFQLLSVHKI